MRASLPAGAAWNVLRARALISFLFAAAGFGMHLDASAQQAPPVHPEIAAVYKAREVDFFFRNSNTNYPCYALQNRVANILLAIGARDDLKVRVSDCDLVPHANDTDPWDDTFRNPTDPFRNPADSFRTRRPEREQTVHVRVQLMTPVQMTPEVLAEIDKDKSRRELISRVTGNPMAAMNDPIVFGARRQTVTLSRKSVRLEPEDCELLEQMTTSVFRELDVRVVRRNFACDRGHTSRIAPQLTVEALLPTGNIVPAPSEGEKRGEQGAPADPQEPSEPATPQDPG